jgi:oligopeptide transport system substrate-binding protein
MISRRRRLLATSTATLFSACLVFLAACSRREPATAAADRAQAFHLGLGGEPGELDPHVIIAPPDYQAVQAFFEGLTRNDPVAFTPSPAVAERWDVSPDGLTYTFHLRASARWSNGDPITAADFLYSFRRALSPALGSIYTFLYKPVRGAADYAAGKLTDFSSVGFAAPDPLTLVVSLARPTPYFLAMITGNPIWFPVHRPTIERYGKIDQRGTAWTRPERIVSNGPFALKSWQPNQRLDGEKSPTYWNAAQVRLATIHFHAIDSKDAEERAFRAGQLHLTRDVPASRFRTYREERSPRLIVAPQLTVNFINVNTARPVLADPRVRRALSLALDRTRYSERVGAGSSTAAFHLVPVGLPGYTPSTRLTENAAEAQALLAAAGFPGGRGFPRFTLSRTSLAAVELSEAMQASWRTILGIDVELAAAEPRTHWSNLERKQYDLGLGGWGADYPDASTFLDLFVTGGGYNFTGWGDPAYDSLLAASSSDLDPANRLAKLQKCEALFLDALPVIPFEFARSKRLQQASVRCWHDSPFDQPDYTTVWLAPP